MTAAAFIKPSQEGHSHPENGWKKLNYLKRINGIDVTPIITDGMERTDARCNDWKNQKNFAWVVHPGVLLLFYKGEYIAYPNSFNAE